MARDKNRNESKAAAKEAKKAKQARKSNKKLMKDFGLDEVRGRRWLFSWRMCFHDCYVSDVRVGCGYRGYRSKVGGQS